MASRPSRIMSRVCGSHSCLFFSMSVMVSASMVSTVSFVLSVARLLTLPVAVKCRCWSSSPNFFVLTCSCHILAMIFSAPNRSFSGNVLLWPWIVTLLYASTSSA